MLAEYSSSAQQLSIVISMLTMLTLLVWVIINAVAVMLLLTSHTSHTTNNIVTKQVESTTLLPILNLSATATNIVTTHSCKVDTLHIQDDYQQISTHIG